MRVGIYQDLRDPPRWERGWGANARAALERIEEAERLGIGAVWCTEHHFFDDGYLPQPLTWCAAVAARTSRIAIGTALIVAPLHHPIHLAEQAAIVDQLSGGRLQVGLGAGYVTREFEAFETDRSARASITKGRIEEIRHLLDAGIVTPAPAQRPLPIWLGAFGPKAARVAGRTGSGLLWIDPDLLAPYTEGLEEGGHDPKSGRMAGIPTMIATADPERAAAALAPHTDYQRQTYEHAASATSAEERMPAMAEGERIAGSGAPAASAPTYEALTPDEIVRRIEAWVVGLPVTDVMFFDSIAGMPDDLVQEYVELLSTEVAPRLKDVGKNPEDAWPLQSGR